MTILIHRLYLHIREAVRIEHLDKPVYWIQFVDWYDYDQKVSFYYPHPLVLTGKISFFTEKFLKQKLPKNSNENEVYAPKVSNQSRELIFQDLI